ncbi:MAG: aldo/keto reductase [Acholeplasmataceae bacterium]|nr:aldo/keto reductase [Acholeplasmataceae bacterium]
MTKTLYNGVKMPRLGLGTFRVADGDVAYQTVRHALSVGYRHIDTAQMYGNEDGVGRAIRDSGIDREAIFITTKQRHHMPPEDAMRAFNDSLERLKTDYVDLFLIHWPNHDKEINQETWRFFESLYDHKKARAIGVCNFQKHHIIDLYETAKIRPMVNQVELHPGLPQIPLKRFLDEQRIATISYGPFMKGEVFKDHYEETLSRLATKYEATIAQVVIAWGLERDIFMIPKSVTPDRIEQNFAARDLVLDPDDIKVINALSRGKRVYTDPDNNPWGVFKPYQP